MRCWAGLTRHCDDLLKIHNSDAGLHVTALLREGIDDQDVVARLGRRGLAAIPLSTSYIGSASQQGLLLGFGCTTSQRLLDSTPELGELLRASARRRNYDKA